MLHAQDKQDDRTSQVIMGISFNHGQWQDGFIAVKIFRLKKLDTTSIPAFLPETLTAMNLPTGSEVIRMHLSYEMASRVEGLRPRQRNAQKEYNGHHLWVNVVNEFPYI